MTEAVQTREGEKMKVKSVKKMREIMTAYYIEAKTARQNGKKVAWITSGGPVEPLVAMDVIPVYPENHAAMIGASHMAVDLCEKAEAMGYCRDLCSYARSDIAASPVNGGPIGGLPAPDFLICCNNICGTVMKWYEVQARYYNVPFYLRYAVLPYGVSDEARRYVRRRSMNIFFRRHAPEIDYTNERIGRVVNRGQRCGRPSITMNRPAPMSAFGAFHLALIVTLRGTQIAVDYYSGLLEDCGAARRRSGRCPTKNTGWDNLPGIKRNGFPTVASHGACLVADTYTSACCARWIISMKMTSLNRWSKVYIYLTSASMKCLK